MMILYDHMPYLYIDIRRYIYICTRNDICTYIHDISHALGGWIFNFEGSCLPQKRLWAEDGGSSDEKSFEYVSIHFEVVIWSQCASLLTNYGLPGHPTTVFGKDCEHTWELVKSAGQAKSCWTISGSHGFYSFLKLQFLGLITACFFLQRWSFFWTKFPKTWNATNGVQNTTFLEMVFTTVLLSYIESKSRNAWQFIVFRKTVVISTHHSSSHWIHAGEAEAKTKLLEEFVGILRWWGIQISNSYLIRNFSVSHAFIFGTAVGTWNFVVPSYTKRGGFLWSTMREFRCLMPKNNSG